MELLTTYSQLLALFSPGDCASGNEQTNDDLPAEASLPSVNE